MDSTDPAAEEQLWLVQKELSHQLRIVHAIGVSSPDYTYVFDCALRFIYVSPPLLKLWGKTLTEVLGKNFEDLGYPADLVELHQRQLQEALTGKTVSGASAYVNFEGVEGHYEYTFVPVYTDEGRIDTIVGTTRDVTAKLKLERERSTVLARLQESEAQFRQFANAIPQLAWIARADGHIDWYNQRWYEYTGTTPAEMEGWGWQKVHDPTELPRVLAAWGRSLANGEPFEMAFPLRAVDGRFRLFLTRVEPIRSSTGGVIRWFGTNTDIEAQRQAIAERDAALEAAAQASRAKDEFLAMLGHELRNPLSPIVTALKLMERRGAASREQEVIQRQVDHLSRLVDDLLDIARITQGKLELRQEPIEIATVVLRGLESASPLLERRAQRVRMDVPAEGLMVSGDRDRLAQVVSNLLTNACKFSEPGAEVFVSAERDGRVIRLRVRDHGIGIAPEMLDRIFGTFVQQRQNIDRAGGGLGLGLSIVQNLVQLHQGTVYARSGGAGTGSEFIVELPALSAMPLDVSEERSVGAAGERRAPGSRRARVLVVDDNQDAADMLGDFLTGLGLDVRVAHDPLSALGVAADFKPEIALIDIGLPVMDGWELGRKLRALLGDDQPKLIAVTGYGQDRDRQQSAANGFAAHLTKPVDLGAVEKLITV